MTVFLMVKNINFIAAVITTMVSQFFYSRNKESLNFCLICLPSDIVRTLFTALYTATRLSVITSIGFLYAYTNSIH